MTFEHTARIGDQTFFVSETVDLGYYDVRGLHVIEHVDRNLQEQMLRSIRLQLYPQD